MICAHLGSIALHRSAHDSLYKPGRPRTKGKAERLIQTLLNEWADARIYGSSAERADALPTYLDRYNYRRPHGGTFVFVRRR